MPAPTRASLLAAVAVVSVAWLVAPAAGSGGHTCLDSNFQPTSHCALDAALAFGLVLPPSSVFEETNVTFSARLLLNSTALSLCSASADDLEFGVRVCEAVGDGVRACAAHGAPLGHRAVARAIGRSDALLVQFALTTAIGDDGTFELVGVVDVPVCVGGGPPSLLHIVSDTASIHVTETKLEVSSWMRGVVLGLACAVECGLLVLFALTLRFRKHDVMTWSQVNFLILMQVCALVGVPSLTMLAYPTPETCAVLLWFTLLPVVAMLACLFGRVWRVHSISLAASRFQRRIVSDKQVFVVAVLLTAPFVLLLLVRTAFHPPRLHNNYFSNEEDYVVVCRSDEQGPYTAAIAVYFGMLMMLGTVVAYRSGKLVAKLNEGKSISFALHNAVVVAILVIAPAFVVDRDPDARYLLLSAGGMLLVCMVIVSVVVPKFVIIRHHLVRVGAPQPRLVQGGGGRGGGGGGGANDPAALLEAPHTDFEVIDGHVPEAIERGVVRVWETLGALRERKDGMAVITEPQLQATKQKVTELNSLLQNATFVHQRRSLKVETPASPAGSGAGAGAAQGPLQAMLHVANRGPTRKTPSFRRKRDKKAEPRAALEFEFYQGGSFSSRYSDDSVMVDLANMNVALANPDECVM